MPPGKPCPGDEAFVAEALSEPLPPLTRDAKCDARVLQRDSSSLVRPRNVSAEVRVSYPCHLTIVCLLDPTTRTAQALDRLQYLQTPLERGLPFLVWNVFPCAINASPGALLDIMGGVRYSLDD